MDGGTPAALASRGPKGAKARARTADGWGPLRQLDGAIDQGASKALRTATSVLRNAPWAQVFTLLDHLASRLVLPDVFCYSAAAAACAGPAGISRRDGHWRMASELLHRMQEHLVAPNERTFSAAISACDKARQWPAALALLREAIQRSVAQGYCYNAAISACEKGGQWITALELFREMRQCQFVGGMVRIGAQACSFRWFRAADLEVDAFSFAAAASACEKGAAWPASLQLHQLLFQVGVQPNVVSFGTALAAASAAPWPTALELLSEMRHYRVTPNIISYNAVVHACEQGAALRDE
eukprot:s5349_g4.t1